MPRESEKLVVKARLRDMDKTNTGDMSSFWFFAEVSLNDWPCFPNRNKEGIKLYHFKGSGIPNFS